MTAASAADRRVLLAFPRSFCAGVERAIATVEKALELCGPPVYVRRQIVHNSFVVAALEKRGAVFIDDVEQVPDEAVVIFSAHGVAPAVRSRAAARDLRVIDATCPLVTKVHHEASRLAAAGFEILLLGQEGHDEVVGIVGEAPDRVRVLDGADQVETLEVRDVNKVAWLSQTTLAVDETRDLVDQLGKRFPALAGPPSDDICYAAQNRQNAVKAMAPEADLVLVVGSGNSHNSNRLVEVAIDSGAGAAHLVGSAAEIDEAWLAGVTTVGLTSGASVPDLLVQQVLHWLAGRGYEHVEELHAAREPQVFALPHELTRPGTVASGRMRS
jgi:4-hydroxy-3-methylbut-2-enyl diphosphate reductase